MNKSSYFEISASLHRVSPSNKRHTQSFGMKSVAGALIRGNTVMSLDMRFVPVNTSFRFEYLKLNLL